MIATEERAALRDLPARAAAAAAGARTGTPPCGRRGPTAPPATLGRALRDRVSFIDASDCTRGRGARPRPTSPCSPPTATARSPERSCARSGSARCRSPRACRSTRRCWPTASAGCCSSPARSRRSPRIWRGWSSTPRGCAAARPSCADCARRSAGRGSPTSSRRSTGELAARRHDEVGDRALRTRLTARAR